MPCKLSRYVLASVTHSQNFAAFSISVDKAAPCKGNLSNGILVFPDNVAAVAVPQVDLERTRLVGDVVVLGCL